MLKILNSQSKGITVRRNRTVPCPRTQVTGFKMASHSAFQGDTPRCPKASSFHTSCWPHEASLCPVLEIHMNKGEEVIQVLLQEPHSRLPTPELKLQ